MSTEASSEPASGDTGGVTVDLKLEVVVVPVADVDRAKRFYGRLGWRLDADVAAGDDFRIVQLTPRGSGCSLQFGTNVASAAGARARPTCARAAAARAARGGGGRETSRSCSPPKTGGLPASSSGRG